jgi:hypothetical protein
VNHQHNPLLSLVLDNPVGSWSTELLQHTVGGAAIAVVIAAIAILRSDAPLRRLRLPSSSALEWVSKAPAARRIITRYRYEGMVPVVLRGLALDTFVLVPAYSLFLTIGCFWSALALETPWRQMGLVVGWLGALAGYLDLVENGCILTQVAGEDPSVARLTNVVSLLKWALLSAALTFLVLSTATQLVCANVCR